MPTAAKCFAGILSFSPLRKETMKLALSFLLPDKGGKRGSKSWRNLPKNSQRWSGGLRQLRMSIRKFIQLQFSF